MCEDNLKRIEKGVRLCLMMEKIITTFRNRCKVFDETNLIDWEIIEN
jgi:hypothetical protein